MASLLLGSQSDDPDRPKKIPKVAVYVTGVAFAVTTGLTLLVLPFVRQAIRLSAPQVQFYSNRHLPRAVQSSMSPSASPPSAPPSTQPSSSFPHAAPISNSMSTFADERADPGLRLSRGFNNREEGDLFGPQPVEGEGTPVGGLMAIQALLVATGLVLGSAGLGMWGVAKFLGVRDMHEFASRMREEMQIRMPILFERVRTEDTESEALDKWLRDIDKEEAALEPKATPS